MTMVAPSPIQNSLAEPSAQTHASLLEPDALEALLQQLVSHRWRRLQPEYADPIGMLMNQGTRQWTAGWVPGANSLYLLVWENDSFKQRAWWRFYENGALIFEEPDGASRGRSALFNKLLESGQLPFVSYKQWLEPVLQYNQSPERRLFAVDSILNTLTARPEIFSALKEPLFAALELDLGNEQWPLLEVLKIHRLAHKNPLLGLFQQLLQRGFIRTLEDKKRLKRALILLQDDYAYLGAQVAPILRPLFEQAYLEFKQLTAGDWRTVLQAAP
jgi:hypothetical protein